MNKIPFPCTVYDSREGRLHLTVHACDPIEAEDEASIAAAENGCQNISEIVVGVHE
jgi:hypothetical protein